MSSAFLSPVVFMEHVKKLGSVCVSGAGWAVNVTKVRLRY